MKNTEWIQECVVRMLLLLSLQRTELIYKWVLCVSSVVTLHAQNLLEYMFLGNVGVYR